MKTWIASKKNQMYCLMGIVFLAILLLTMLTPLLADDFGYALKNSWIDIFKREFQQYMGWGGRSVAHILARIFLSLPKAIFNIVNSLVFVGMTLLMYFHAKGNTKLDSPTVYLFVVASVFLFVPTFGQTVLWVTGSCNYLWMMTLVLLFLLPFRLQLEDEKAVHKFFPMGMFFLGVLAGWTNENTGGAAILCALLLLGIRKIIYKRKIPLWMILGVLGSFIGFMVLVLAPGNALRAVAVIEEARPTTELRLWRFVGYEGTFFKIYDLCRKLIEVFVDKFSLLLVLFSSGVAFLFINKKTQKIGVAWIYCLSGVAAVVAMLLSPTTQVSENSLWGRSLFSAVIFILMAIAVVIDQLHEEKEWYKGVVVLVVALMTSATLIYGKAFIDLSYLFYQNKIRENYIEQQKSLGNYNVVVFPLELEYSTSYNAQRELSDLETSKEFWVNDGYADYHGIESVQATNWNYWKQVYRQANPALMNIQNLQEYVDAVTNEKYITLVTSTTINKMTPEIKYLFEKVGIEKFALGNCINGRYSMEYTEFKTGEYVEFYGTIGGVNYYVSSAENERITDVVINEIKFSGNNKGITFVVYDQVENRVVDVVTFDVESGKAIRTLK